jgi:hypothetical protein
VVGNIDPSGMGTFTDVPIAAIFPASTRMVWLLHSSPVSGLITIAAEMAITCPCAGALDKTLQRRQAKTRRSEAFMPQWSPIRPEGLLAIRPRETPPRSTNI